MKRILIAFLLTPAGAVAFGLFCALIRNDGAVQ